MAVVISLREMVDEMQLVSSESHALNKIHGSGAFRRFKDTIYRYGIEKDWFKFRADAYKEIAIDWLERNDLAYTDELNRRAQSR